MRRYALMLAALAGTALAAPAATPQPSDNEVRNLRFSMQAVGDSLVFSARWNAPPRGRLESPVTGYEWQFAASDDDRLSIGDPSDVVLATGETPEREFRVTAYHDCATGRPWYGARVRALGAWEPESAPWTETAPLMGPIECDDTPPVVPPIQLDTLPVDTVASPPDAVEFAAVPVEPVTFAASLTDGLDGWTAFAGDVPVETSLGLAGHPITGSWLHVTAPIGREQAVEVRAEYRGPEGIGGPVARLDPQTGDHYRLQWADGAGAYQVREYAGTSMAGVLASWTPPTIPRAGDVDLLRMETRTVGTAVEIRGMVRGAERIVVTDPTPARGSYAGLVLASDPGGIRPLYRDFSASGLGVAPVRIAESGVRWTALGSAVDLCAWTVRNGVRRKAAPSIVPAPEFGDPGAPYQMETEPLPTAQACWRVIALPRGQDG